MNLYQENCDEVVLSVARSSLSVFVVCGLWFAGGRMYCLPPNTLQAVVHFSSNVEAPSVETVRELPEHKHVSGENEQVVDNARQMRAEQEAARQEAAARQEESGRPTEGRSIVMKGLRCG